MESRQRVETCFVRSTLLFLFLGMATIAGAYPTIPNTGVMFMPDMPLGSYVKGRDAGMSFSYGGQNCFFFGDTALTQNNADGKSWISDSMYHTTDTNGDDGVAGGFNYQTSGQAARQWILLTSAEASGNIALWAESAFYDSVNSKQYVVYAKINYSTGGIGIGTAQVTSLTSNPTRIQHRPGQGEPSLLFLNSDVNTIDVNTCVTGGYVYFFFVGSGDWGNIRIGRASLTGEAWKTFSNWRFYDGTNWVTSFASAAVITNGVGVGSVEWNAYLNCWLFTYDVWCGNDMQMRVADNPWGPWSAAKTIYNCVVPSSAFDYMGRAHKCLEKSNGQFQYTSYSMPMLSDNTERVPMMRVMFNPPTPAMGVAYRICSRHIGKCLDDTGSSTADGTDMNQYKPISGTNQQWILEDAGSGYVKIKNKYSGKYLEQDGSNINNGSPIQQWTGNTGTNQQWQLVATGDGYYKIKNRWSGRLVDVTGGNMGDSVPINAYDDSGATHQQWVFFIP